MYTAKRCWILFYSALQQAVSLLPYTNILKSIALLVFLNIDISILYFPIHQKNYFDFSIKMHELF